MDTWSLDDYIAHILQHESPAKSLQVPDNLRILQAVAAVSQPAAAAAGRQVRFRV